LSAAPGVRAGRCADRSRLRLPSAPGAATGSINLRRSLSTKESTHPRCASVLIGMRRPGAAPTRSAAPTPNVARGFPP